MEVLGQDPPALGGSRGVWLLADALPAAASPDSLSGLTT